MGGGDLDAHSSATNETNDCLTQKCSHPHFLPEWRPNPTTIAVQDRVGRAVVLTFAAVYLFLGLGIVSDKFYSAIDTIVSKKRMVKVTSKITGREQMVAIPIWNETVAHLTMFVFGTCAPEILLSVTETVMTNFHIGEVGPMVILGSTFNLFLTGGICILSVKRKSKRIEELRIFFASAGWGCIAYVWLFLILDQISPGYIEPWEAVVTLALFPLMVVTSYIVDRNFFGFFKRLVRMKRRASSLITPSSDSSSRTTMSGLSNSSSEEICDCPKVDDINVHLDQVEEVEAAKMVMEQRQARFLCLIKKCRARHPHKPLSEIYEQAELNIIKEMPKSMSYYRMLASKNENEIINKEKLRAKFIKAGSTTKRPLKAREQVILFDPAEYRVMESCGFCQVSVIREGKHLNNTVTVQYATEDDSGIAGSDYEAVKGTLTFQPGEKLKHIAIKIFEDDAFNLDSQFYVNLFNAELLDHNQEWNLFSHHVKLDPNLSRATVTIIDEDHGGIFQFEQDQLTVEEDVGEVQIKIVRNSGAEAVVLLPYRIISETAIKGVHFADLSTNQGTIIFPDHQTEQILKLSIINEESLSKSVTLGIELDEPVWCEKCMGDKIGETEQLGKPKLGDISKLTITINENARLRKALETISTLDLAELIGSVSWASQFVDAVRITASSSGGSTRNEEQNDEEMNIPRNNNNNNNNSSSNNDLDVSTTPNKPSCKDYILYSVTLFWKTLFACIPPTGMLHGWPAFFCSLVIIGVLMALASDIAVQLGCTIGLKVELTAISFIAMGVSLPDILASWLAATKEEHADAAIGHMTGRIPVSIFVGFGLSWTIASLKNAAENGHYLQVNVKSLTFTIVLFFLFAGVAIVTLLLRRLNPIGGELGGKRTIAILSGCIFFVLWLVYIVVSALASYCVISTF